jgi:hypothetical protein
LQKIESAINSWRAIIMTVIFQLFCVDDLKELGPDGPDRLREFLRPLLDPYRPKGASGAANTSEPARFTLEASNETVLKSADKTPPEILEAIQKRSEEVSQQLISPSPGDPSGRPKLDPSQALFPQVSAQPSMQPASAAKKKQNEETILQWAISCEVNNFNLYYPLLQIKKEAYKWFLMETGKRPKGPDSPYSPFNPLHPLYNLFYDLEQQSPPPDAQGGPPPSAP